MNFEIKPTKIAPRTATFGHGDDWKKESAILISSEPLNARDRVNFVMLNVDNTKWEQELDEFCVEGIPHFAFLDREGNEEENIVAGFLDKLSLRMSMPLPVGKDRSLIPMWSDHSQLLNPDN